MKLVYIKPTTENVVVKCNEKLMWGELADQSNNYHHNDAKGVNFEGDDEDEPAQGTNLWDGWDD